MFWKVSDDVNRGLCRTQGCSHKIMVGKRMGPADDVLAALDVSDHVEEQEAQQVSVHLYIMCVSKQRNWAAWVCKSRLQH